GGLTVFGLADRPRRDDHRGTRDIRAVRVDGQGTQRGGDRGAAVRLDRRSGVGLRGLRGLVRGGSLRQLRGRFVAGGEALGNFLKLLPAVAHLGAGANPVLNQPGNRPDVVAERREGGRVGVDHHAVAALFDIQPGGELPSGEDVGLDEVGVEPGGDRVLVGRRLVLPYLT